ncbi:MAG: hypothetical protein K2M15_05370 [Oscillospiraceae bacterium]|nr:hypothetical protein [Oscillospiraceae bacterium]
MDYYDPFIPQCRYKGQWYQGLEKIDPAILQRYDLVAVTTAHSNVDYEMVANAGVPVFDCKNVMKNGCNRAEIEGL